MAKEAEIVKIAEELFQEAINANSYFLILEQYDENYRDYVNELLMSPAFYSIAYLAMQNALFLELSKLYDRTKDTINLGYLIKLCEENKCIPENRTLKTKDGKIQKIPYIHKIREEEKWYFKDYSSGEQELGELLINTNKPDLFYVKVTASEYIGFLGKQYNALNKITENLKNQRNKIYAHNDGKLGFDLKDFLDQNSLCNLDMQKLIDYAFDVTRFVIGALTGTEKGTSYKNINDWRGTLDYVRIGMKYKDLEVNSQIKKLVQENFLE